MQGGIHPDLPGTFYADLIRAVKARVPGMHVHAFSPMEIMNGAAKRGVSHAAFLEELRDAGLDTIPGTAAEILDDDVRWLLTKGKLPADTWESIVRTAHELGIRSSSTIMYGHVDAPPHWVFHIRRIARIQADTGGFTEFVPLPFVHRNAPIYLAGAARPGPSFDDNAAHARGRAHPARRSYPQRPGVVGETRSRCVPADLASRCERFRRHADGGDDQSHGRRAVGDRDDAGAIRRRDPRDRSDPGGAHDDVRPHRYASRTPQRRHIGQPR